ncbi:MAG: hypothetical protein NC400_10720 [Clostridium sp.]|nr:hypothetical protein [Clostridium sp.]
MERLKRIFEKWFILPPVLAAVISIPLFALVIFVLDREISGALAYLSYLGSAYALIIAVIAFPKLIRGIRRRIDNHPLKKWLEGTALGGKYLHDISFRTKVSLYMGLTVNLAYILMKLAAGVYYRSLWLISLGIYYILLAVMRFLLLHKVQWNEVGADREKELRRYRLCGGMLLVMNQALAGIVIFMVHQNRGFDYPGLLIYAMAAYSFYIVITAFINVIRSRRYGSPILLAAKAVNLVAAMVSILSLETAMLARFGGDDKAFRAVMTGATGGGICTIVIGMAVFMIVKSTRQLKELEGAGEAAVKGKESMINGRK